MLTTKCAGVFAISAIATLASIAFRSVLEGLQGMRTKSAARATSKMEPSAFGPLG